MAGVSSMAAIFFQDFLANLSGLELHFESYTADSLWTGAVSPLVHSISHFAWWWGCYLLRPTHNGKEDLYYLNNYVTSGRVLKGQVWRWDICPLTLSGLNIGLLLDLRVQLTIPLSLRTWKSLVTELSMPQWRRPPTPIWAIWMRPEWDFSNLEEPTQTASSAKGWTEIQTHQRSTQNNEVTLLKIWQPLT